MRRLGIALSFIAALSLSLWAWAPVHAENAVGPSNAILCNKFATLAVGPSAITKIISGVAGQTLVICGWDVSNTGATGTFSFSTGTGTNCGTSTVLIIPPLNITSTAPAVDRQATAWAQIGTPGTPLDLCVTPSVATIAVVVYYAQYS